MTELHWGVRVQEAFNGCSADRPHHQNNNKNVSSLLGMTRVYNENELRKKKITLEYILLPYLA
jgi:hypothetical protein